MVSGRTLTSEDYPVSNMERLLKYMQPRESGCWEWTGTRSRYGYGTMWGAGQGNGCKAHRISYELFVGAIPSGLELDHVCENRACVNPEHLEPVTHTENLRRRGERSTTCNRGHPWTKPFVSGKNRACLTCRREFWKS